MYRRVLVAASMVVALGVSGCGFAVATDPVRNTVTVTTTPTIKPPSFNKANDGFNDEVVDENGDALLPQTTVPADQVTTTTAPVPVKVPTRKESTYEEREALIDPNAVGLCKVSDNIAMLGTRIGSLGLTPDAHNQTLTREEQAIGIDALKDMARIFPGFIELAVESDAVKVDDSVTDAIVSDIDRRAKAEPADGDARDTLTEFMAAHEKDLNKIMRGVTLECPDGAMYKMLTFQTG